MRFAIELAESRVSGRFKLAEARVCGRFELAGIESTVIPKASEGLGIGSVDRI